MEGGGQILGKLGKYPRWYLLGEGAFWLKGEESLPFGSVVGI